MLNYLTANLQNYYFYETNNNIGHDACDGYGYVCRHQTSVR